MWKIDFKKVCTRCGSWVIERDGSMLHVNPSRPGYYDYYIEGDRLNEGNWVTHMIEKRWVNAQEFIRAFFTACQKRGLERVTLNANYLF